MFYRDTRGIELPFGSLRHYYGDVVRILFVILALMIAISTPFGGDVPFGLAVGVPTVLVLIILAGLTNPRGKLILMADAAVSIIGVILGEWFAIETFTQQAYISFAVLELICVLFLISLYFSMKTVRAMESHMVGRAEPPDEPRL
ncbi:MAG TPA: hypothetical protein VMH91_01635 [Candidatus Paceibacterota bacterium]|nr:hypothetical protein [Candidatus Paceibacterota bacterium]